MVSMRKLVLKLDANKANGLYTNGFHKKSGYRTVFIILNYSVIQESMQILNTYGTVKPQGNCL